MQFVCRQCFGRTPNKTRQDACLLDLSVKPLAAVELFITVRMRRELDRLSIAQPQKTGHGEAIVEQAVDASGQRIIEIDHDIPAQDDMELIERAIGHQVVLSKDDILIKRALKDDMVI